MRRKTFVMAGVGACIAALASALARAQERFPQHAISLLVPFPPGGVADIVARSLAPVMERRLGRPVLVVNKPGAGGALGTGVVAAAKPDGYTLLVALASISTNPEQERLNKRPAPFQLNQLAPVARISTEEMMLAIRADSKYRSVGDVVEDARQRLRTRRGYANTQPNPNPMSISFCEGLTSAVEVVKKTLLLPSEVHTKKAIDSETNDIAVFCPCSSNFSCGGSTRRVRRE